MSAWGWVESLTFTFCAVFQLPVVNVSVERLKTTPSIESLTLTVAEGREGSLTPTVWFWFQFVVVNVRVDGLKAGLVRMSVHPPSTVPATKFDVVSLGGVAATSSEAGCTTGRTSTRQTSPLAQ